MAAQDGQLNGTELGVYIGGTLIAYSTSASLNINHSPRSYKQQRRWWMGNIYGRISKLGCFM